jgi:SNF2 family DNA or RNA helicase
MPQLWDHQERMLNFALHDSAEDYALAYAGLSTGKTLFGLEYLSRFSGLKLVLCPAAAMRVWQADYDEFYDDPHFELHVLDKGSSTAKWGTLEELQRQRANAIIVLSYETAARIELNTFNFTASVSDEAQRFGQHNGIQSMKIAKDLVKVPYKVAMTGTPYHDGYEKLYGITRYLDCYVPPHKKSHPQSRLFGHYDEFLRNYCTTFTRGYTQIITGYKNLERLASQIKPFTIVIRTEDVHDLPEYTERTYKVKLAPKVRKVYSEIESEGATIYEGTALLAPHVLTRTIRLQQIASAGVLVGEDRSEVYFDVTERLNVLSDILESLNDLPVVVFTKYDREVSLIAERLDAMKVSYGILTGSRNDYETWEGGVGRVLIANLKAGSESVRLQRAAHTIFWSVGYSVKEFVQARGRTRRSNQLSDTVHYHYIVTENTVDEELYKVLHEKSLEVSELDEYLKD